MKGFEDAVPTTLCTCNHSITTTIGRYVYFAESGVIGTQWSVTSYITTAITTSDFSKYTTNVVIPTTAPSPIVVCSLSNAREVTMERIDAAPPPSPTVAPAYLYIMFYYDTIPSNEWYNNTWIALNAGIEAVKENEYCWPKKYIIGKLPSSLAQAAGPTNDTIPVPHDLTLHLPTVKVGRSSNCRFVGSNNVVPPPGMLACGDDGDTGFQYHCATDTGESYRCPLAGDGDYQASWWPRARCQIAGMVAGKVSG